MLEQSNCKEHWMHMIKIYFVNIITGFLNVLNQPKEPLMQNFVFFWVKEEWHIQRFCLRNLYSIIDHGNIYGIKLVKHHDWRLISYDYVVAEQLLARGIECIWGRFTSWISLATGFLIVSNQPKEPLMQNFVFFRVKEEWHIQRFRLREMHILSLTMETFVALK